MTSDTSLEKGELQARLLAEALPFMQRYENKTIVVKYGGHAMGDISLGRAFARDIALLKQSGINPIVVHGGGPQIGAMLARMGIESKFEGGLRVTDQMTVEIVEMVLAGSINKEIVALINAEGEWAIGLCGKDGNMVFAEKAQKKFKDPDSNIERVLDLGFVGEPVEVDRTLLDLLAPSPNQNALVAYITASGRDYIIQGQQAFAFTTHSKPQSLDYWLRQHYANNHDTKQAENLVLAALVATGLFAIVPKLTCPDSGARCKGIRLVS